MKKTLTVLFALLVITAPLFGAAPPDRMNFQGVLRNASNAPQNGTFDMVFEFYDAATLGDQIILDSHLAAGSGAVTVSNGLFNVQLGSGVVTDGTGPLNYTFLAYVFRDYSDVFVQIQVGAEILSPRIQVVSAGHALNAENAQTSDTVDGLDSTELLRSDASDNFTSGTLTLDPGTTLAVSGSLTLPASGISGAGPGSGLNADLLDGLNSTAFATASHAHELLTAGTGLGGGTYDGGTAKTFSVTYGTAADTAVQGNQTATITAGSGLTGGTSANALGDGFSTTVNAVGGNGIAVAADSIALGDLTGDWTQSGPFNIVLNNASSELSIAGASGFFFGVLDVGTLSGTRIYTFPDASGTVWTSGNDGATSTLDADLLDGLNSGNASGNIPVSNGTLNTNLNADLLDGLDSTAFVEGTQTATITAGDGLSGGVSADALGDGFSATVNVGAGNGISVAVDTVLLGPLTANWNQTGAFDLSLNNASSELSMLESTGATFFGTLDVGDLAANQTYTFSGANGTVWTTGNDGAASTLDADLLDGLNSGNASGNIPISNGTLNTNLNADLLDGLGSGNASGNIPVSNGTLNTNLNADLLDGIDSGSFLRSDATDQYTSGTLTLDTGTAFYVNGTFRVGNDLCTDSDTIFFDCSSTGESLTWNDTNTRFELSDALYLTSTIQAGVVDAAAGSDYNSFREDTSAPVSGLMGNPGDLYVQNDLEVGSRLDIGDGSVHVADIDGSGAYALIITSESYASPTGDHGLVFRAAGNLVDFALDTDNDETGGTFTWFSNANELVSANRIMQLSSNTANLYIGGTLFQNTAFDLAESFQVGEPMEAGDLVRISPNSPKEVLLTQGVGDPTVLGVVSAKPGVVLGGSAFSEKGLREVWGDQIADQYLGKREQLKSEVLGKPNGLLERRKHLDSIHSASLLAKDEIDEDGKKQLQDHAEMVARYESDLEGEALTAFFERHMAPVALSGRTPVKVDTQFGEIKIGDELGPSPIPGVAMKLTSSGPTIGTAMENFSGGRGMVLTFVHRGSYAPTGGLETQTALQDEIKKPQIATEVATTNGNFQVMLDRDADDESRFSVFEDGKDGVANEVFRVDEEGNVYAKGAFRPASMDLAEYHRVSEAVEVGDVLAADRTMPGIMSKANTAYDPAVVGIVSAKPGVLMGSGISEMAAVDSDLAAQLESARSRGDRKEEAGVWKQLQAKFGRTHAPIALSGTVLCKVDAGYGGIEVGNLLVASPTSGHAMRSDNPLPGTVVGKALEPLAAGAGLIRVLVMLR